jgi:hypothetical protein
MGDLFSRFSQMGAVFGRCAPKNYLRENLHDHIYMAARKQNAQSEELGVLLSVQIFKIRLNDGRTIQPA